MVTNDVLRPGGGVFYVLPVLLVQLAIAATAVDSAGSPTSNKAGTTYAQGTETARPDSLKEEHFHRMMDTMTNKIMRDIEKYKAEDPNWGKPTDADVEMDDEEAPLKNECDFECPEGLIQINNPDFDMPSFNSCKMYDEMWDKIRGASVCCANHQRCYYTCLRDRVQCDAEFDQCMVSLCDHLVEAGKANTDQVKEACHGTMGMMGMMVMEPGCALYPKAQGAACRCMDPAAAAASAGDQTTAYSRPAAEREDQGEQRPTIGVESDTFPLDDDDDDEDDDDADNELTFQRNDDDDDQDQRKQDRDEL